MTGLDWRLVLRELSSFRLFDRAYRNRGEPGPDLLKVLDEYKKIKSRIVHDGVLKCDREDKPWVSLKPRHTLLGKTIRLAINRLCFGVKPTVEDQLRSLIIMGEVLFPKAWRRFYSDSKKLNDLSDLEKMKTRFFEIATETKEMQHLVLNFNKHAQDSLGTLEEQKSAYLMFIFEQYYRDSTEQVRKLFSTVTRDLVARI